METDYSKVKIINIRRGTGERNIYWYAKVVDENNELVINASLDYCVKTVMERLDKQNGIVEDPEV